MAFCLFVNWFLLVTLFKGCPDLKTKLQKLSKLTRLPPKLSTYYELKFELKCIYIYIYRQLEVQCVCSGNTTLPCLPELTQTLNGGEAPAAITLWVQRSERRRIQITVRLSNRSACMFVQGYNTGYSAARNTLIRFGFHLRVSSNNRGTRPEREAPPGKLESGNGIMTLWQPVLVPTFGYKTVFGRFDSSQWHLLIFYVWTKDLGAEFIETLRQVSHDLQKGVAWC